LCRRSAREQSDLCHRSARGESENGGRQCDFRRAKSGESEKAERNRCEQSEKAERNGKQSEAKARQSEARSARARSEPRCEQSDERSESCECVSAPRSTTCCASCGKVCASGVVEHTTDDGDTREAAGELLCETTLSSLDAAIVTRRRRRMTSFAFPSGARQRARLYTSDALCDDGGPAPSTQTAPTAPTARTAAPPRFPPPLPMCAETCNWASDADSDDVGGPGAELGTDCCRQGRQRRLLGSAFIGRSGHCHGYARLAVSVPPRPSALPT